MIQLLSHQADFAAQEKALAPDGEDRQRLVRLRIVQLEGALVRVRSIGAARIAESCGWQRRLEDARESAEQWTAKAAVAIAAGREDLARAAYAEARRAKDEADVLKRQIAAAVPQICELESNLARIEYALSCLR